MIDAQSNRDSFCLAHVALMLALGILCSMPLAAEPVHSAITLSACGSSIEARFREGTASIPRQDLIEWINAAAHAVCTYYGRFPVPHLTLDVHGGSRPGIHHGVTYARDGGFITISVGPETTREQLLDDWMLTHEMIHLAFPSMTEAHHWIEEGISTYVEPVARVQAGELSAGEMWRQFVRDMPQGEPKAGDRGLDHTPTWGRIYWGGAMFCLVADVRIRERTGTRKGLQDALREILREGGGITQNWTIDRALSVGDQFTGTTVLEELYREMRSQPSPVDLPGLWNKLGLRTMENGALQLDNLAPLSHVREAITRPANSKVTLEAMPRELRPWMPRTPVQRK